jgi:type I restriction enzyme R subunit
MPLAESMIEQTALDRLRDLGRRVVFGPSIAPEELRAERADYEQAYLSNRLRKALRLKSMRGEVRMKA